MSVSRVFLRKAAGVVAVVLVLAGCAADPGTAEFNDPYEVQNRRVHEFNRRVDRAIVGPGAASYGGVVPAPARRGVQNFAGNLGLPGDVVNNLLQGRPGPAVRNGFRFAFNTIFGLGGLLDPAADAGLFREKTDFGETLFVWGVREGAYLELPLLGPTTERRLAGRAVDLALDPVGYALGTPERYYATGARVIARIGDRDTFSGVIDSTLYRSADSYAQTRLLYIQNRRFELGAESDDDVFDPYEDIYGP